jgi:hypothetical protein
MAVVNKNQMAGMRGDARTRFYLPDDDCLPRFNYSTGAGWRIKNNGHLKWGSRTTNKGKLRRCYR